MKDWLRHAFAIEPASAFVPTAAEAELVRRACAELARRQLTLPASVLLESCRPMGNLGAQVLWSTYPWFAALTDATGVKVLAGMLERPGAVDYMLDQLQSEKPRDCHPWVSSEGHLKEPPP
jgi:hypothetical protein